MLASGDNSPIAVTNLNWLAANSFTVVAVNAVGDSNESAPSNLIVPAANGAMAFQDSDGTSNYELLRRSDGTYLLKDGVEIKKIAPNSTYHPQQIIAPRSCSYVAVFFAVNPGYSEISSGELVYMEIDKQNLSITTKPIRSNACFYQAAICPAGDVIHVVLTDFTSHLQNLVYLRRDGTMPVAQELPGNMSFKFIAVDENEINLAGNIMNESGHYDRIYLRKLDRSGNFIKEWLQRPCTAAESTNGDSIFGFSTTSTGFLISGQLVSSTPTFQGVVFTINKSLDAGSYSLKYSAADRQTYVPTMLSDGSILFSINDHKLVRVNPTGEVFTQPLAHDVTSTSILLKDDRGVVLYQSDYAAKTTLQFFSLTTGWTKI